MLHLAVALLLLMGLAMPAMAGPARPDIIVIMFDDFSPRIGAYGDRIARTPNLDAFARDSIRFSRAYTSSPVCAPSRAAIFSGMHQQAIGAQHMRTRGAASLPSGGPIPYDAVPPADVKWFPELLRAAGYHAVNVGKTDYQIGDPFTIWDVNAADADWRRVPAGKPLFAFINLFRTHESFLWPVGMESDRPLVQQILARNRRILGDAPPETDPSQVRVPAFLPDTPVVRADIARLYDNIARDDAAVGEILAQLRADGRLETSVVIITGDHGDGLPRMKRAIQAPGLHVPLMIRMPGRKGAGTVVDTPVSLIDLAPTILSMAKAPIPDWMQGRPLVGRGAAAGRRPLLAAADRFDEVPERQRSLIDGRWQYVRNFRPDVAQLRPLAFRDVLPTMQEIWRLHRAGQLPPAIEQWLSAPRQAEELYDLEADPDAVTNLAGDPRHAARVARMRRMLEAAAKSVGDLGELPEEAMIARMWPSMVQPETAAPDIGLEPAGDGYMARLTSATPGASIGYRLDDSPGWALFSAPFPVSPGSRIETRAIRYGFAPSPPAAAKVPTMPDRIGETR